MSIQYAFVVYMVGLPTHINLTSLSRANHFYRAKRVLYEGACIPTFVPSCFHHHGDYICAEILFFVRQVLLYFTISIASISVIDLAILHLPFFFFFLVHSIFSFLT